MKGAEFKGREEIWRGRTFEGLERSRAFKGREKKLKGRTFEGLREELKGAKFKGRRKNGERKVT